jgi:hypothetical protein
MPTQSSPNLDDLLRVLNAATDKSMLHWQPTSVEDTFRAEFGVGLVRISKVDAVHRYGLCLLDDNGVLLEDFEPSEEGTRLAFETLYKKARNQALDLEDKLKNVYDHLKALAGES